MALRISIPVLSAPGMDQVRVMLAVTNDAGAPPDPLHPLWQTVAWVDVADLPTSVLTHPIPRGSQAWTRAAGYIDGVRSSEWSTPVLTAIPLHPGFASASIVAGTTGPSLVTWAHNAVTVGVRVRWSVQEIGTEPDYATAEDFAAAAGSAGVGGVVPVGSSIAARLESWSGFAAGSVSGTQGQVLTLLDLRPSDIVTPVDNVGSIACRIYMDADLELYVIDDVDYCLMIDPPGA